MEVHNTIAALMTESRRLGCIEGVSEGESIIFFCCQTDAKKAWGKGRFEDIINQGLNQRNFNNITSRI
jgi:hypothetical protein